MFDRTTVTPEAVAHEVRALAEADPGFVYTMPLTGTKSRSSCAYTQPYGVDPYNPDNTPQPEKGCIVGRALHALDVPVEALVSHEGDGAADVIRDIAGTSPKEFHASPSHVYAQWVDLVQQCQDDGLAWGSAIAEADRCHPLPKEVTT